jgi:hypothetical protein
LAIVTYSTSEHPPDHLSHCLFIFKSTAHASAPACTGFGPYRKTAFRIVTPRLYVGKRVAVKVEYKEADGR